MAPAVVRAIMQADGPIGRPAGPAVRLRRFAQFPIARARVLPAVLDYTRPLGNGARALARRPEI
jgi:hypothetical protein